MILRLRRWHAGLWGLLAVTLPAAWWGAWSLRAGPEPRAVLGAERLDESPVPEWWSVPGWAGEDLAWTGRVRPAVSVLRDGSGRPLAVHLAIAPARGADPRAGAVTGAEGGFGAEADGSALAPAPLLYWRADEAPGGIGGRFLLGGYPLLGERTYALPPAALSAAGRLVLVSLAFDEELGSAPLAQRVSDRAGAGPLPVRSRPGEAEGAPGEGR